ncbi:SAM-dependent methyltransferase [Weissella ceti]|uniref:SAM-dependent methyltransferase n=1 Tax=Weissella ceti TaxID=759620 RepID=A0ABT3E4R1_9LACO|nr:SAM-dependent methyltransferase [Weissella ceti]MCW0953207.1 SAM-dependent methyltransferase [Weissella ceti]QVK12724.1 SAM-dependent methyltransferase [Weissella ceti]
MKPVLDMTAGGRMMWPSKKNELAVFVDKRFEAIKFVDRGYIREHEVFPDIQADWSDINGLPFMSGSFHQVIFDPPHLLRAGPNSWLRKKYGVLDKVTWKRDLERGFEEAARLLADNGTLIFKWNSDQIKLSEVLNLVPDELVATIQNRVKKTYICVFIKQSMVKE